MKTKVKISQCILYCDHCDYNKHETDVFVDVGGRICCKRCKWAIHLYEKDEIEKGEEK